MSDPAFTSIAQMLQNKRDRAMINPFAVAGEVLKTDAPRTDTGQAFSGLARGILNIVGARQAQNDFTESVGQVAPMIASRNYQGLLSDPDMAPLGVSLLNNDISRAQRLEDLGAELQLRTNASAQDRLNTLQIENPFLYKKLLQRGAYGQQSQGGQDMAPVVGEPGQVAKPLEQQSIASIPGAPNLGIPTLREVERQDFEQKMESGMPLQQAAVSARQNTEFLRNQAKNLFGKPLSEHATRMAELEQMVADLDRGIGMAGNTGIPMASAYEKAASLLPWAEEAKQQAGGDALLGQVGMKAVSQTKGALPGALSNWESQKLFSVAPGTDKPPAVNMALLDRYKQVLQVGRDYQDFMSYVADTTAGNPQAAQTMWELYKRENPVVAQAEDGQWSVNPNRKPWQQFDFQDAYRRFLRGESPTPQDMPQGLGAGQQQGASGVSREAALEELRRRGLL